MKLPKVLRKKLIIAHHKVAPNVAPNVAIVVNKVDKGYSKS